MNDEWKSPAFHPLAFVSSPDAGLIVKEAHPSTLAEKSSLPSFCKGGVQQQQQQQQKKKKKKKKEKKRKEMDSRSPDQVEGRLRGNDKKKLVS